jgi:hypothetical protein
VHAVRAYALVGNPEVEAKWVRLRHAVLGDVGHHRDVVVRIPHWEPTRLEEGFEWARLSVYEGWYVTHLLDGSTGPPTLWFKIWEYGDDEPAARARPRGGV